MVAWQACRARRRCPAARRPRSLEALRLLVRHVAVVTEQTSVLRGIAEDRIEAVQTGTVLLDFTAANRTFTALTRILLNFELSPLGRCSALPIHQTNEGAPSQRKQGDRSPFAACSISALTRAKIQSAASVSLFVSLRFGTSSPEIPCLREQSVLTPLCCPKRCPGYKHQRSVVPHTLETKLKRLAPRAGLEPATIRLTVECSTS